MPPLLDEVRDRFVLAALPKPMDESCADGTGQQGELKAEFELAWAVLREAATDQSVAARSDALLALCERAVEACQQERVSNRAEVASLVTLVRDAVRAIAGEGQTFSKDITASIERFDALRHVPDLRELKARLSAEVVQLKAFASERESRWQSMEGQFEQRIEQLTQQLTDTRREATIDPLTGAANRRLFEEAFEAMMASGERDIVVAMFDVDNFKRINDTLGHAAGDAVLIAVADAIKAVVRANDVMSRLGGDEFAVLMGGITLRQAELRLRSIMNTVATTTVGPDNETPATISCGRSELSAGDTRDALLARADRALYDAKRAGKSRMIMREAPFIRALAGPAAPRPRRAAGAR